MSTHASTLAGPPASGPPNEPAAVPRARDRRGSWVPTPALIRTRRLELRKRRGLMIAVVLLTVGLPVIVLGIRMILHAASPHTYGPAGSPDVFSGLVDPMYFFGFIISATLGATAGTTDLTDGVFRQLVVTGRSRMALYLARIPAGLSILLPLVALGFTVLCMVTAYAGTPQPKTLEASGIHVPLHLDEAHLETWLLQQPPSVVGQAFGLVGPGGGGDGGSGPFGGHQKVAQPVAPTQAEVTTLVHQQIGRIYDNYVGDEHSALNPPPNEMAKIGFWLELEVLIGFTVGLGFGTLVGQRTVATIMLIVLEVIVTPIAANANLPHFINVQRLVVGVAMDQMRPEALSSGGAHGPGGLGIAPMPTWAMVAVIVGWIIAWSVVGAWRMVTRDA